MMGAYQLYKKEHVSIALDVDNASFLTEKYQLIEQGFERIGDQINAKNKKEALKHINQVTLDSLREYALAHLPGTFILVLIGIASYFRFM